MTRGGSRSRTPSGALVEGQHGSDLFVTSLTGEFVRIYPMPVWMALEEKMAKVPSTHPARAKFFDRVNYFGQTAAFDNQGRVIIHPRLRESAAMSGEVDVFGQYEFLDVWNHERFVDQAPARTLHRRRRASARGVRDLGMTDTPRHEPVMPAEVVALPRSRRAAACSSTAPPVSAGTAPSFSTSGADAPDRARSRRGRASHRRRAPDPLRRPGGTRALGLSAARPPCSTPAASAASTACSPIWACRRCSSTRDGRGFTFRRDEPLDMRMDRSQGPTVGRAAGRRRGRGPGQRDLPVRRGTAFAPGRPGHRPASRFRTDRDHRRAGGEWCGGRCRHAAISGSTPRPGRSRRCGSGSTASSKGSTRSWRRPPAGCWPARGFAVIYVSLARGPHRQAHLPRDRGGRRRLAGADAAGRSPR